MDLEVGVPNAVAAYAACPQRRCSRSGSSFTACIACRSGRAAVRLQDAGFRLCSRVIADYLRDKGIANVPLIFVLDDSAVLLRTQALLLSRFGTGAFGDSMLRKTVEEANKDGVPVPMVPEWLRDLLEVGTLVRPHRRVDENLELDWPRVLNLAINQVEARRVMFGVIGLVGTSALVDGGGTNAVRRSTAMSSEAEWGVSVNVTWDDSARMTLVRMIAGQWPDAVLVPRAPRVDRKRPTKNTSTRGT